MVGRLPQPDIRDQDGVPFQIFYGISGNGKSLLLLLLHACMHACKLAALNYCLMQTTTSGLLRMPGRLSATLQRTTPPYAPLLSVSSHIRRNTVVYLPVVTTYILVQVRFVDAIAKHVAAAKAAGVGK